MVPFLMMNRFSTLSGLALIASVALLLNSNVLRAAEPGLYIAEFDNEGVAIKRLEVDPVAGKFGEITPIFRDKGTRLIHNLAISADGHRLASVNREEVDPQYRCVFLLGTSNKITEARKVLLPQKPEDLCFWNDKVIVFTSRSELHLIDHATGQIEKSVEVRNLVNPPAHLIETMALIPGEPVVVCVMKEDAPGEGPRRGGRVIGLNLPDLSVKFDLKLDAQVVGGLDKTGAFGVEALRQLSFGKASRLQDSAPNGIVFSRESNTAAIGLDNYGAVVLCDLDGFVGGELKNASLLSPIASPGLWFPDKPCVVKMNGLDRFIFGSAGADGKAAIFGAPERTLLQTLDIGAPASFGWMAQAPSLNTTIFTRGGISRLRGVDRINESHREMSELVILSHPPAAGEPARMTLRNFPDKVYHVTRASLANENLLLMGLMVPEPRVMKLGVYDLSKGELTDLRECNDVLRGSGFATPAD
jgi:hypothetical protein